MAPMGLKVMISSVRRGGLGPVRDAVAPVLEILGYEPVRFETVTARPVPSRTVCIEMVHQCDVYLLLLGAEYGEPVPDSGIAPTEEEWTVARNLGKPIVVFRQLDTSPDGRQTAFIRAVEDYHTGVFRETFRDTADLLSKLKPALAAATDALQPMSPRKLAAAVEAPWRSSEGTPGWANPGLETHFLPVGADELLGQRVLRQMPSELARLGRQGGLFDEGEALTLAATEDVASAMTGSRQRQPAAGISIRSDGGVSIWQALPRQALGASYEEVAIAHRVARDIRLVAGSQLLHAPEVAVAIGLTGIAMLGQQAGSNSMTFPFMGRADSDARVAAREAFRSEALARIADELGAELAARLTSRLRLPEGP